MEGKTIFDKSNFGLGVDLQKAALEELNFLEIIYNMRELRQNDDIDRAIWRYEYLWLPFAAEYVENYGVLAAPPDIEWIWQCHLLSPLDYEKDCLKITGSLIDHNLFTSILKDLKLRETYKLWKNKYESEPYVIVHPIIKEVSPFELPTTASNISYNIRAALERQKNFYYEVSLPHFREKHFLTKALERYQKFLFLRQQFPSVFLVPSYDIDLMWHTHQLHPVIYQRDTKRLLGRVFNHDDSVGDRSPGSKLSQATAETRDLWNNTFWEPFTLPGAMYRGDPPNGKLGTVSVDTLTTMATKVSEVTLKQIDIQIQGLPARSSELVLDISLDLSEYSKRNQSSARPRMALGKLKGPDGHWHSENLCRFEFDSLTCQCMHFSLSQKIGSFCRVSYEDSGELLHDLATTIESSYPDGGMVEKFLLNSSDRLKMMLKADLSPPTLGRIVLTVIPGVYETRIIPETSEQMWGPIPLARLPPKVVNTCDVASHRLVDPHGNLQFICRTIHSLPLVMSAIQVFYKYKMVVVGHLIGTDQLPLRSQVEWPCPAIEIGSNDRAILIKNNAGDWGIMLGRWKGFKKGIKGGILGSPGYLEVKLFQMASERWETIKTDYEFCGYEVNINEMTVDLKSGIIKADVPDTAENLAVAFGLGLLHVLCQPRPMNWKPGKDIPTSRGGRPVRSIPSEDMALILAAGYITSAPTNHYLFNTHRKNMAEICAGCGGIGGSWCFISDTPENSNTDKMEYLTAYFDGDWGRVVPGVNDSCGGCGGCQGGDRDGGGSGGGRVGYSGGSIYDRRAGRIGYDLRHTGDRSIVGGYGGGCMGGFP